MNKTYRDLVLTRIRGAVGAAHRGFAALSAADTPV